MKHFLIVLALLMVTITPARAQFVDRIVRGCVGAVPQASVIVNPSSSGNIVLTTCSGGSVVINGTAVVPGGGTINPTNGFVPVRSNATTFVNSPIFVSGTSISADTATGSFSVGDINVNGNNTTLSLTDSAGQLGFGTAFGNANAAATGVLITTFDTASSGNQFFSPRLELAGAGWRTSSGGASQPVSWGIETRPIQGTTAPSSKLVFSQSINGGAFADVGAFTSGGNFGVGTISPTGMLSVGASSQFQVSSAGVVLAPSYTTATNCADSAGAAACGAAAAGAVVIDAAATTVVVSTTAVGANSQVFIQEQPALNTRLSVTCNTTTGRDYTVTALTAGTSFTITASAAPVTNPACLSYFIVN